MAINNQDVLPLRKVALAQAAEALDAEALMKDASDPITAQAYLVRSEWHLEVAAQFVALATQLTTRKEYHNGRNEESS